MASRRRESDDGHMCRTLEEVLHALHAPIRCEILFLLTNGEQDVSSIADALDLDISTVSHNLATLRKHGLVQRREEHKRHIYDHAACVHATTRDGHIEVTVTAEDGGTVTLNTHTFPPRKKS